VSRSRLSMFRMHAGASFLFFSAYSCPLCFAGDVGHGRASKPFAASAVGTGDMGRERFGRSRMLRVVPGGQTGCRMRNAWRGTPD